MSKGIGLVAITAITTSVMTVMNVMAIAVVVEKENPVMDIVSSIHNIHHGQGFHYDYDESTLISCGCARRSYRGTGRRAILG